MNNISAINRTSRNRNYEQYLPALEKCELFKDLQKNQILLFLQSANPQILDFRKGELILQPSEKLIGVGVVLSGKIIISKQTVQGINNIIAITGGGGIFGEIAAFAKKGSKATVCANSDCAIIFLNTDSLVNYKESEKLREILSTNLLQAITTRVLIMDQKLEYLAIRNLRARFCAYIIDVYSQREAKIFMLKLNRAQLADYLGVSRPSLSREMAWLRDKGCIDFHGSSIKIFDLEMLKTFVKNG